MSRTPATVRAAVYTRVSLDATGEQLAVTRQREDCLAIAAKRGWTVVHEFQDNSISASDQRRDRPGYNGLVSAYLAGEFDALICYDLDRLTRQPRQLEDWIDAAEKDGLLLVTSNGEADLTTDGGQLFARIKLAVAKAEVQRKSARQTRAALQRAEQGKVPKGPRLTGYATDGQVVPEEARRVRDLFEKFLAGNSLRALTALLADSGTLPRSGGRWNPSTVRTLLTNPRYAGRAVYQGQVTGVTGDWDAIVPEAVFDAVQVQLGDPRRRTQVGTDRKYLGSGLYLCGVCDQPLRSHSGGRYRCPQGGHVTRLQGSIDRYVLEVLRARLARPDLTDLLIPADTEKSKAISEEISSLRARLGQIEADYDGGMIDGFRFKVASEKVRAQLQTLESQRIRAAGASSAASTLSAADPVAAFDASTLGEQRTTLDLLMVVRLLPAARGVKFHEQVDTVKIEWKV